MKDQTPTPKRPPDEAKQAPAKPSPVQSPAFRSWLADQLAQAEKVVATGPGGTGWTYNETKRAEAEEFAAALKEVQALTAGSKKS